MNAWDVLGVDKNNIKMYLPNKYCCYGPDSCGSG